MSEAHLYEEPEGEEGAEGAEGEEFLDASRRIEESEPEEPIAASPEPQVRDFDAEARRGGWKPQAEFVAAGGDAAKWVDAKRFVERGQEWAGALRQQVTRLEREREREAARRDAEINELRTSLSEAMKLASAANKQGYERAMRELKARQREAAAQADTAAFDAYAEEIEKLGPPPSEPAPAPKPQGAPGIDPAVSAFMDANPWFDTNAELNGAMIGTHNRVRQERPDLPLGETLRIAKARVVARYPESFSPSETPVPQDRNEAPPAPRRAAPSVAAPSGGAPPRRNASAFDRISDAEERAEARRQFDRLKKGQPGLTPETYVDLLIGAESDVVALVERDKRNAAR